MELRKSNFKKANETSVDRNSKRVQIMDEPINKDVLETVKNKNPKTDNINYDDLYEDRDIKCVDNEIIREEEPDEEDPLMKVKRLSVRGKELGKLRQSLKKDKNEEDEYNTEDVNTKLNTKLNEEVVQKKDDEELNKVKNKYYGRKRYFNKSNEKDDEDKNKEFLNRSTENRKYINVNKSYNLSQKEKEAQKENKDENKNPSKKIYLYNYNTNNNPQKKIFSNYREQKNRNLNKEVSDDSKEEKRPSGVFKYFFHSNNNSDDKQLKLLNKNNNATMGVIDYSMGDEEKITNAKIAYRKERTIEPFFDNNRSFEYRKKYNDDIAKKNLDKVYEDIKRAEERKKLRNQYLKYDNELNDDNKEKTGPKKEIESFYERFRKRRNLDISRNDKNNNNSYQNEKYTYTRFNTVETNNDENKDNSRNNSTKYRYFHKYNRASNDLTNDNKQKENKEPEIKKPEENVRSHSWARRRYFKQSIDEDNNNKIENDNKMGNKNMKVFKEYLNARKFREEYEKNKDNKNFTLVEEEPRLRRYLGKYNTNYRYKSDNLTLKEPTNVRNEEEIIEEEINTSKQKPIVRRYYMKITGKNREEIDKQKEREKRRETDRQKALERQKEIERKREIERQQKEREKQKLEREKQRIEREKQQKELERKREIERQRKQRELERERKKKELEKQRELEKEKEKEERFYNNSVGRRRNYYIKTETDNNQNEDFNIDRYRRRPKFKAVLDRIEVTKDVKYYKDKPYSRVNTEANENREELVKREIYKFNKNIEGDNNNRRAIGKPFVIEIRKEEEKIINKEEEEVVDANNSSYRKRRYYNK